MSKFQFLNVTERLQALYAEGQDWALDALEAVEFYDSAFEALKHMGEMRALFGLPKDCDAWRVAEKVESLLACAQQLVEGSTRPGGVPVVPGALLDGLEDCLPRLDN